MENRKAIRDEFLPEVISAAKLCRTQIEPTRFIGFIDQREYGFVNSGCCIKF
jgi:hypothetical protein